MSASEIPPPNNHKKRNLILFLLIGFFVAIGLGWFLYWFFIGSYYVSTEDAYVAGNRVMLTSEVTSGVETIYVDDTDLVEEGELLVSLDRSKYALIFQQRKEMLGNTVRDVAQLFENVREKEALVNVRSSELNQAKLDLSNREGLSTIGAISVEEFEKMTTSVDVAEAQLQFALRDLESAEVLVEGTTVATHPRVQNAVSALKEAYLDLLRCDIFSPARGYISKRSVQLGDWAIPGTPLMIVVPLDYLWAEANYKETQLTNVRIGQPVTFTADLHGSDIVYHGHVVGFSGGTGSAFALLPAQNASGNWIKIVQRLPVRITIGCEELKKNPLFIGLSLRTEIDTHDRLGEMLASDPANGIENPAYVTFIYKREEEKLRELNGEIETIINENQRCQ